MSSGRKKSEASNIKAPPRVTSYEFQSPSGDRFQTSVSGNKQTSQSQLSPQTASLVNLSQNGMLDLAGDFLKPDAARAADIRSRADDFYNLQAQGINEFADRTMSQAQSDLSKRFGGTYNATFGADYMARLTNNRMNLLSDARQQANLFAEDLHTSDETARINRFNMLQNYMTNLYNQSIGAANIGVNFLSNENQRATDLAARRAQLLQQANQYDEQAAANNRRQNAAMLIQLAGAFV